MTRTTLITVTSAALLLAAAPLWAQNAASPSAASDTPAASSDTVPATGGSAEDGGLTDAQAIQGGGTMTHTSIPIQRIDRISQAEEASPEARERADREGLSRLETKADDPIVEAADALAKTRDAVDALAAGDALAALDLLADATGELEVLIARRPMLALAPAETRVIERDLLADLATIERLCDEIEDLVDDGRIQEARVLMRDLASELVLETVNLPLATYPDVLVAAAAHVEAGEVDAALAILASALSTTVVTETIIPLPPLRAEAVLAEAEVLLARPDRTGADNDAIEALLDVARHQVEMGRALGYGARADYRAVLDEIDRIEDEAEETVVERAFAQVRATLSRVFD